MKKFEPYFLSLICPLIFFGCASNNSTSTVDLGASQKTKYIIPFAVAGKNPGMLPIYYSDALKAETADQRVRANNNISSGVSVTASSNSVNISYIHQNDRGTLKNNYTATFLFDITSNGEVYTMDVVCPTNLTNDLSELSGLSWLPYLSKEKIAQNVSSLCKNTILHFTVVEKGEINSDFNDSSVFANFSRKMKTYTPDEKEVRTYDLEKSKWFYVSDNNRYDKVAISVYPYRNGSKIVYSSMRAVNCRPSTPCEYDPEFANRLRAKLTQIAAD